MEFKKAKLSDLPQINKLILEEFPYTKQSERSIEERFSNPEIFFFKIVPRAKRTQENAVTYSTVLGFCHAFLILIVYLIFSFATPEFGSLFGYPYLYSGAQMSIMIPSALVILLTGFTYGAICGGVISGLIFIEKI